MNSPLRRSVGLQRTLLFTACTCLVLSNGCHKPRFQSSLAEDESHNPARPEAGVCADSRCIDSAVTPASPSEETIISAPSTGVDSGHDVISNLDASLLDASGSGDPQSSSLENTDGSMVTRTDSSSRSSTLSTPAPSSDLTNSNSSAPNDTEPSSDTNSSSPATDSTQSSETTGSTVPSDAGVPQPQATDASNVAFGDAALSDGGLDSDGNGSADGSVEGGAGDAQSDAAGTQPALNCELTTVLSGIVRDFDEEHPDMEPCDDEGVNCSSERGLVASLLGNDNKPVFVSEARDDDSTIQSADTFNQWFRDVEGVNVAIPFDLQLTTRPRMLVFDSDNPPPGSPAGFSVEPPGFFPIDEWNETERPHNYHFTYEVAAFIEFKAGDTLTIRGDDDIFVFIDRRLVVDLGGIHLPQEATIEFDTLAEELELQADTVYEFRLFFAERHVEQSNLRLSTNGQFYNCTTE